MEEDNTGKLRGCLLCISQDGTIAVVAMDALEMCGYMLVLCLGTNNVGLAFTLSLELLRRCVQCIFPAKA